MTRTSHVSRSLCGFNNKAESTGIRVSASNKLPPIANVMLNAIGLNSLPSSPSSANKGRNTTIIIKMAKVIGFTTSRAAANTASVRLTSSVSVLRSAITRNEFSTTTTAPSTIMPIPMARPARDMRLAERPASSINTNAMSIVSGIETTTTTAGRHSPRNKNRITPTRIAP